MAAAEASLFGLHTIIPAVIMGLIIGALETYFLIKDESSAGAGAVLAHSITAFIQVTVLVFFAMHQELFTSLFPSLATIPILGFFLASTIGYRILIGAIEYILLEFKGRAVTGRLGGQAGFHEGYIHVLIIVLTTVFSPEIWGLIASIIPLGF